MTRLKTLELNSKKYLIYDSLNNAKNIDYILNTCESIINNPIFLVDTSYSVISRSNMSYNISSCVTYNNKDFLLPKIIKNLEETHCIDHIYKCKYAFLHEDVDTGDKLIFCPIKINDITVSYICILEENTYLTEDHIEISNVLSNVISLYMLKENFSISNSGLSEEYCLIDILENKIDDLDYINERFKNTKFISKSNFTLISMPFKQKSTDYRFNFALKQIIDNCKYIFKNSLCAYYEDNIILLISTQKDFIFDEYSYDDFKSFLSLNDLKAGISFSFSDLKDIYDFYIQSLYSSKINSKNQIYYFEDYIEYYILDMLCGKKHFHNIKLNKLIHPYIYIIINHDKINHTELLKTLKCYIENNRNVNIVSDKLFIHRSTVFYRLKKIETIVNLNLDNIIDKTALGFKILDYINYNKNSCL